MTRPDDLVGLETKEIELGLDESNSNDGDEASYNRNADDYLRNDKSELRTREITAYVVSEGGITSCKISANVG